VCQVLAPSDGLSKGQIVIQGKIYGLRLTLGALAEITSRLSAKGPQDLSLRLRSLNAADGRVLLACLMCADGPAVSLTDREIAKAMPVICKLFEEAFSDG